PQGERPRAGRRAGKPATTPAPGRGWGRARALASAREGARVWATDLNAKTLAEIEGKDGIRTRVLDVTDPAGIAKTAQEAGEVNVLFNCAGSVQHGNLRARPPDEWNLYS